MAEKFALYAGPPLAAVLAGYEHARSARANQVADDWLAMVKELTPTLTSAEWAAVCDGLNSYSMGDFQSLSLAWAAIDGQPELGEKWSIEHPALVRALRALSDGQNRALRETVELVSAASRGARSEPGARVRCDQKTDMLLRIGCSSVTIGEVVAALASI